MKPSMATTSTWSRNAWGRPASHVLNACLEWPSSMSNRRPGFQISTRRPSARTATLAVFHDSARAAAIRAPLRWPTKRALRAPKTSPARQPPSWLRRLAGVLAPHVAAGLAEVAVQLDDQGGAPPVQRFVRQPADNAFTPLARPAAASAPPVLGDDTAGEVGSVRLEVLAGHYQPEAIEAAERARIGRGEAAHTGGVEYVGSFQSACVRTPIVGRS